MSEPTIDEGRPPAIESSEAEETELSLDEVCHLLQNERRRDVLQYLAVREEEVKIGDLADHIAAKEQEIPVEQVGSDQRKRVYISLYQNHLPKLEKANAIEYDSDRGTLTRCRTTKALHRAIARLRAVAAGEEPPEDAEETSEGRGFSGLVPWLNE